MLRGMHRFIFQHEGRNTHAVIFAQLYHGFSGFKREGHLHLHRHRMGFSGLKVFIFNDKTATDTVIGLLANDFLALIHIKGQGIGVTR